MALKITTIGYKLQFVGLIGGRVNWGAGYKPAPQLGRQIAVYFVIKTPRSTSGLRLGR